MKLVKLYLNDFQPFYWWLRSILEYHILQAGSIAYGGDISNDDVSNTLGIIPVCVI